MAHYEPPHQDLCCLQIQLFLSLVVKELIGERVYRVYIHIDKGRNSVLKYLGHHCFFDEKYYSDNETIVIIADVCSRLGSLNNSTCFALDD